MAERGSNRMIVNAHEDEVEKKYKFGRTLGQGTFATVKMATCVTDGSKWAVKIIKRSALTSEDEESLKMEIQILQLTNHSNIVSVKEVFYCKNYVYLVMDLMTGGELFDRIVTKDHYSEQEAKHALIQIVTAIKYCHEKNIVHRDLKPENILYQGPEDDSPLKLADFGLAALLRPNQLMTVACGTPGYVAPEILRGVAYGKEVDIWSIGVILYILLCGFPPFYDDNNKKLFAQIVNANYSFPDPYWTNISPHAKDLVTKLLVVDPSKRLTADEILQHPWMGEDGASLPLDHFKTNLKSYNARRRFRSAIRAVQITQLLKNLTKAGNSQPQSIMAVIESSGKPPENVNHVHSVNSVHSATDDEDSDAEHSIRSHDSGNVPVASSGRRKSKDGENPLASPLEKIPEAMVESSVKATPIPPIKTTIETTATVTPASAQTPKSVVSPTNATAPRKSSIGNSHHLSPSTPNARSSANHHPTPATTTAAGNNKTSSIKSPPSTSRRMSK